jgi:2,4-dienoyl-CoA reductase-like NADH-dependent reductase (Old Yellow Enzyme family)
VTAAVREAWPDGKPVFVRFSATDWLPDRESWTLKDSVRLADALADRGADLIDASSGGVHPDRQVPGTGSGYQVPYAERVREGTERDVAVGAVGKITTPEQADAIVRNGRADVTIVGREHLRDPYFALHAARELGAEGVEPPVQYQRAF